ncbi:MAG: ABC transporter ATP-binding protein [Planctomycetota bacterium]
MNPTDAGPAADERPLLEIETLGVSFPAPGGKRLHAVDGASLSVFPNQTLAVVGESGSGKSVTALSVLRLVPTPPAKNERGRLLWRRPDQAEAVDLLTQTDKPLRKVRGGQIAMIFQEPMTSLNPVYSIGDQLLEAIYLHQTSNRAEAVAAAESALADVGIADPSARLREFPHQLSGGMRQRVMIAMALACRPDLLLADEPTTALDVTIQAQILELLRRIQREKGMGVLLITHDLGVVAENADVVAVMYSGRVVEYANVNTLFARPLHPYTRGLLRSMPVLGQRVDRLPTVADGAVAPDDFPAGFRVAPHDLSPPPVPNYGGEHARLHQVEPNHWVLCEPVEGSLPDPPTPRLAWRREDAAVSV